MPKLVNKECACGSFEYSVTFKNLGDAYVEIYCPFCGQADDEATEAYDRLVNKKKKAVDYGNDEED